MESWTETMETLIGKSGWTLSDWPESARLKVRECAKVLDDHLASINPHYTGESWDTHCRLYVNALAHPDTMYSMRCDLIAQLRHAAAMADHVGSQSHV